MPYYDKNAILKALTKEQVIKIVTDLGSKGYRTDSSGNLIFQTICHGGDSYKLYYYHEPTDQYSGRTFHCYTSCSESFSIFELVIRAKRVQGITYTWYQAVSYIANQIDMKAVEHIERPKHICDMSWLKKFGKNKSTDIIDCEPRHQNLIGIRGRYLDEEDVENIGKYVPLNIEGKFLSHKLSHNLYGIHINQNKIKTCRKCLLLESEKGVMQNHSYFGDDDFSLAVCGSEISDEQIKLLLDYLKIEELILGFDKEYKDPYGWDGELYKNKLFKKIRPIIPYCKVSILWDKDGVLDYKDAPTDKGKETLLKLLDDKVEITMEDITLEGTYYV